MKNNKKLITILLILSIILIAAGTGIAIYLNHEFTINFNADGGTTIESQKVVRNKVISEPIAPYKEGYVFDYWEATGEFFDFSTKVTKDINLTAIYNEVTEEDIAQNYYQYVVSFSVVGDITLDYVIEDEFISLGNKVEQPNIELPEGYIFDGWYLNDEPYDFSKPVTQDLTLTLKYHQ